MPFDLLQDGCKEKHCPFFFLCIQKKKQEEEMALQFWSRQFSEHALFLYTSLSSETAKKNTLRNHQDWKQVFEKVSRNQLHVDRSVITNLCKQTIQLLRNLHRESLDGQGFIGWVFPSFIQHMEEETQYFMHEWNGSPLDACEEIGFWADHHSQAAGLSGHLMDPSEKVQTQENLNMADQFDALKKQIAIQCDKNESSPSPMSLLKWNELSDSILQANATFISQKQNNEILSAMPLLLAEHEQREFEYAQSIIGQK